MKIMKNLLFFNEKFMILYLIIGIKPQILVYWQILDPRLKKLSLFDSDTKQNIIEKLKEIYLQYEENETLVNENSSNLSETSRYSSNFFERRT